MSLDVNGVLPRTRLQLARRPWIRWAAVIALATLAGGSVATALRRVDEARRAWGETVVVMVAGADTAAGEPLTMHAADVPSGLVPAAAVTAEVDGAVARRAVAAGALLTELDVSSRGAASWLPAGWVQLVVPTERTPPVRPGDSVRVFADAVALADGQVVRVDEASVVVGVPPQAAGPVAAAANDHRAVIGAMPRPPA